MKNIGLYIHIPFCVKKCNYCAFTSFTHISNDIKGKYIDKLILEIKNRTTNLENKKIKWIYIGGGTPNTLSIAQLKRIIKNLPNDYEELTIELNPGIMQNSDQESIIYLDKLRELGFTRLSVGVQSFNNEELKLLGRIHNVKVAKDFLTNIQNSEFEDYNIDLIIGLPNQSKKIVLSNIEIASQFEPTHISTYLLSIDPKTKFEELYQKNKLELPEDSFLEDIYFSAIDKLDSLGYKQYEISNFSTLRQAQGPELSNNGLECKYNLNTWRNGEYIGCGLSASGFYNNKRYTNTSDLEQYLNGEYKDFEGINSDLSNFETKILLGLRLREFLDFEELLAKLPRDFQFEFKEKLENLRNNGLIERKNKKIRIPSDKILLSDNIITKLLV